MATPGSPAKRLVHDGRHRHFWVPELATPDAPTVAELTDPEAFDFSRYVPKNGVSGDPSENYVDAGDITETFDAQDVGTWGEQLTIEGYKQHPDDDFFEFFATTKTGYWVNLWAATGASPEDGDPCYVRHVKNHTAKPLPHAPNEKQRCRVGFASVEEPVYTATVVSGS